MDTEESLTMIKYFLEGLEALGAPLESVYLTLGTKYYGLHLGQNYLTPMREDQSRHMPPDQYYVCEDYLRTRVADGASWQWTCLIPGPIIGESSGAKTTMSLMVIIAIYGTLCHEYGIDMRCASLPRGRCLQLAY